MTDPTDPSAGHLDLETLADLDEGLLDPEQEAAARAHLDGCAQCRDDLAALSSVRDLLAADAGDQVMPDDVATRLHTALSAEPALVAGAEQADEPVQPAATASVTTLPERPYDRQRSRNAWMAGLAVAAVLVLLVFGISVLPHSSESKSSSAAGTTAAAAPAVTATSSGRHYTRTDLGAQALALVGQAPGSTGSAAAGGSAAPAAGTTAAGTTAAATSATSAASAAGGGSASSASSAAASAAPSAAPAASGKSPNGQFNGGPSQTAAGAPTTTTVAPTPSTDVLAPLRKPGAAQACLSSYDSSAGAPLAIDFATFDGRPAVIGVFRDPEHPGQYEVIAVGPPGCTLYQFARPTTP